jgi:hypothetical protein
MNEAPTPAAVALAASNISNATLRTSKVDSTYIREYKRFKTYVTTKRAQGVFEQRDSFIARDTVDLYFSEIVSRLTCTPKTASRVRPALQYYADNVEYIGGDRFIVCSNDVNAALDTQSISYAESKLIERKDPHLNLPCYNLTEAEHLLVLRDIFTSDVSNWKSLSASWNLGNNAFLRCDTFVKLRLSNLVFNTTHGPKLSGPSAPVAPMLAYLLNPLDLKGGRGPAKDGHSHGLSLSDSKAAKRKTRMAGCWRHRNYLRCATGMLCFNLFSSLHYNIDLDFFDHDKKRRPTWWNKKLFSDWKDTKAAGTAYGKILEKLGISWGKIIHMRSAGIEYASSRGGLGVGEVSSMSKHQVNILEKCYMTELFPSVLHVMAGFEKGEPYINPRTHITIPWGPEDVIKRLFPSISMWRQQYASPSGDHSKAAQNLLYGVLPFATEVVIQDGIFFIKDFPNHEVTKLLLKVMPPTFERWAKGMRDQMEKDLESSNQDKLKALDKASLGAFKCIREDLKSGFKMAEERLDAMLEKKFQKYYDETRRDNILCNNHHAVPPVPPATQGLQNRRMLNNTLRNSPLLPVFPASLPTSVVACTLQYCTLDLRKWEDVKMSTWPRKTKMAYGRRKYLQGEAMRRARLLQVGSLQQRLERAGIRMDEERGLLGKSVSQYIVHLKAHDTSVIKRARR